jgi:hypothetical protein
MRNHFRFKFFTQFFAVFTMTTPLIAIPYLSYEFNNWWLLIGILISFIGAMLAESKPIIFYLASIFCIGFWFKAGFNIHQYVTFYFFCLLFGFMFYRITMEYKKLFKEELMGMINDESLDEETKRYLKKKLD